MVLSPFGAASLAAGKDTMDPRAMGVKRFDVFFFDFFHTLFLRAHAHVAATMPKLFLAATMPQAPGVNRPGPGVSTIRDPTLAYAM
jgi:hypothetical protein